MCVMMSGRRDVERADVKHCLQKSKTKTQTTLKLPLKRAIWLWTFSEICKTFSACCRFFSLFFCSKSVSAWIYGFWGNPVLKTDAQILLAEIEIHKKKLFDSFKTLQIFFRIFPRFFGTRSLRRRGFRFIPPKLDFLWIFEILAVLKTYGPVHVRSSVELHWYLGLQCHDLY